MASETLVHEIGNGRASSTESRISPVLLRVGAFTLVTFALSAPCQYMVISAGNIMAGGGLYALAGMWSPGIAAFMTAALFRQRISSFGWRWGKTRYQVWSVFIPFLYCLAGYGLVWLLGLGDFMPDQALERIKYLFPLGLPVTCIATLGEEIGWSGFFVPQLFRRYGFTSVALARGIVWSVWHYPMIIAGIYANRTPVWYNLICFTVLLTGISFAFAWFRLRSGSLWTGMFLHASHNWFIQAYFTRITAATALTPYFIDEFGAALALMACVTAYVFWNMRGRIAPERA